MIPRIGGLDPINRSKLPETTFYLNDESGRVTGTVDGYEAVKQAARLILHTERYRHLIYSYAYGTELEGLTGRADTFLFPELKRRVTEALCTDDRITGTSGFSFSREGGRVQVRFTVHTVYGDDGLAMEI